MSLIEASILGLTQGLTEFLPISSSAHLRLVPEVRADLTAIVVAGWHRVAGRATPDQASLRLAGLLVLGIDSCAVGDESPDGITL